MCLSKIKNQGYKIADKDLYTIKFLKTGLIAPFQNFEYELQYKLNESTEWAFHSDYKTKDKAQDALIYFSDFAFGWSIVEKPTTELETIQRNINRIDLLILSLVLLTF